MLTPVMDRSVGIDRRRVILAGALIAAAGLAVYARTFFAPFVFDAAPIVTRYPSIRHLWPPWAALQPPHDGSTIEGRPMLNFTLALSYALGGTRPWAYHAMNLAIHLLAGLVLFGVVRRTLLRGPEERAGCALALAAVIALLWTVHPLQTESVTYIIQRAESQMGLCYLLTLYGFIRFAERDEPSSLAKASAAKGGGRGGWAVLAVLACLLGMATKEVMVSAPLIVFLYDRTFVAGTFREAWRRRRGLHLALASTWIVLAWLAVGTGNRSGTAGLGGGLPWSDYVRTQAYATVRYLRLAVWPHPLVFDYGAVVTGGTATLLSAGIVGILLGSTLFALRRNLPAGFLGAAFFAILAPTTLVPVATQTIAEHRMYLPLAAVLAALVLGLDWLWAQGNMGRVPRKQRGFFMLAGWLTAAAACAALTVRRNAVYGSEVALWADTVVHWPANARAHTQLGDALYRSGRVAEAADQFRQSLRLQPLRNPAAHYDLGNCLLEEGALTEALAELGEAVRLDPGNSDAHNNLGNALAASRRLDEAMAEYRAALAADPANAKARGNLAVACFNAGNLQAAAGRIPEALAQYEEALRLNPAFPEAEDNLGNALWAAGRLGEAIGHYRAALRLRPDYPRAQANLEKALRQLP